MKRKKQPANPKSKFHRSDFESSQDTVATPSVIAPIIKARNFRMADWRSNPELVKYAQQRFAEPHFQLLLAVMDNEHVRNMTYTVPVPEHSDSKQLGKIEGWDLFRNTLASAEAPFVRPEAIRATYAKENNKI